MPRSISMNIQSHVPVSLIAQSIKTFTQADQPVPRNTSALVRSILELWCEACGVESVTSQEEALDICSQVGIARPERLVINSGKEVSAQHFLSSTGRQQVQNNNAEELEEALIKALGNND
jgi:hypothetical protein